MCVIHMYIVTCKFKTFNPDPNRTLFSQHVSVCKYMPAFPIKNPSCAFY